MNSDSATVGYWMERVWSSMMKLQVYSGAHVLNLMYNVDVWLNAMNNMDMCGVELCLKERVLRKRHVEFYCLIFLKLVIEHFQAIDFQDYRDGKKAKTRHYNSAMERLSNVYV